MADELYDPAKHGEIIPTSAVDVGELYDPKKHGAIVADAPERPDLTLGEMPAKFATNLIPSLAGQGAKIIGGIQHGVGNAVEALKGNVSPAIQGIKDILAAGTGTNMFMGGWSPIDALRPSNVLGDFWKPAEDVRNTYGEKYGTGQKILNTLGYDPGEAVMDVGMAAMPAARLAGAPGMVGKIGNAARVAEVATDPIALSIKSLGLAKDIVKQGVGVSTGATARPFEEAYRDAYLGGDKNRNFKAAQTGPVDYEKLIDTVRGGVKQMHSDSWDNYLKNKNDPNHGWSKDANTIQFEPISEKWRKIEQDMFTKGGLPDVSDETFKGIAKIGEDIRLWERNKGARTPDDIDGLKRRISEYSTPDSPGRVKSAVAEINGTIKNQLVKEAPGYAEAMKHASEALTQEKNMVDALGLKDTQAIHTAMTKLQQTMRNGAQANFGHSNNMLDRLQKGTGIDIRPTLAGAALNDWAPRGIARAGASTMGPAGIMALATMGNPLAALIAGGAGLASSSPRLMGNVAHAAGRAFGVPHRIEMRAGLPEGTLSAPVSAPARQMIRAQEPNSQGVEWPPPGFGYADGGEVDQQDAPTTMPAMPSIFSDPMAALRARARGPGYRFQLQPAQLPTPQAPPLMPWPTEQKAPTFYDQMQTSVKGLGDTLKHQDDAFVIKNLNDLRAKYAAAAKPAETAAAPEAPRALTPTEAPEGSNATTAGPVLAMPQLVDLIKKAGGTDEEAKTMAAIALAESSGVPTITNMKAPDKSYGLWQINMLGDMGPQRLAKFGLKSNEDLLDPETNARVALALKRARNGYQDWTTYTSGAHRKHLPAETS